MSQINQKFIEPNVGVLDRWIRVAGGLTLLSFSASGRLGRVGSFLGILVGAQAVACGITRYSPLYDLLGISTDMDETDPIVQSKQITDGVQPQTLQENPAVSDLPLPREFPWESPRRRQAMTRRIETD